jgi:hypothetical protein
MSLKFIDQNDTRVHCLHARILLHVDTEPGHAAWRSPAMSRILPILVLTVMLVVGGVWLSRERATADEAPPAAGDAVAESADAAPAPPDEPAGDEADDAATAAEADDTATAAEADDAASAPPVPAGYEALAPAATSGARPSKPPRASSRPISITRP